MTVKELIARLLCKLAFHRYYKQEFRRTGYATLGWHLGPDREYGYLYRCSCGKERQRGGYVTWADKQRHPEAYNTRGWPIDANGEELPVK